MPELQQMAAAALLLLLVSPAACARLPYPKSVAMTGGAQHARAHIGRDDKGMTPVSAASSDAAVGKRKPPKKMDFRTPKGLFIQERASKQLPGPGQHFSFGALVEWDAIQKMLDDRPGAKLVLLVRHGQAISNWLGDELGPDEWFKWESKCFYQNGTESWTLFDAELTSKGQEESKALNGMLADSGWWQKLSGGRPVHALVSPLSRCLQTASLVMQNISFAAVHVEENIRETLGEDSCDARRSISSVTEGKGRIGPCEFDTGLGEKFPEFSFPVVNESARASLRVGALGKHESHGSDKREGLGFGLISDADTMWTEDREAQKHQVKRAVRFMKDVFEFVEERVVLVVTHSGTVRSLLLAVGREPYRPQNVELVPVLVEEIEPPAAGDEDEDSSGSEDA